MTRNTQPTYKSLTVQQRINRARAVLSDPEGQSLARLRRSCLTIIEHITPITAPEVIAAKARLAKLTPQSLRQRGVFTGGV